MESSQPSSSTDLPHVFQPVRLVPGSFVLTEEKNRQICAAAHTAERGSGEAHPIFGFIAALAGVTESVAEAIALAGCSIAAGPVLASCRLSFERPLQVGMTYQVEGQIEMKVRKPSRRYGAADHLLLTFAIGADAVRYAALELRMIVPAGVA